MMKKLVLFLLVMLVLIPASFALDRETTDLIVIIKVPAIITNGMIKPDRPPEITALRKESYNLYDPSSKTFICIMTVDANDLDSMRNLIATFQVKDAEEITAEKEAAIKLVFLDFDDIKALVEDNIEFAGETKEEWEARKGL